MIPEVMSTEESDPDGSAHFLTRSIPWRNDKVTKFLHSMDHKHLKTLSGRSRRMSFDRVLGLPSDRACPHCIPEWIRK